MIEEKPIVYHEREGEESLESFKDGWRHVRFMLVNAPGYLYSIPGLVMGVVGLLLMGLAATGISIGGATFSVRTMIVGSLLTLVGYQVGSFGVFSSVAANPIASRTTRSRDACGRKRASSVAPPLAHASSVSARHGPA